MSKFQKQPLIAYLDTQATELDRRADRIAETHLKNVAEAREKNELTIREMETWFAQCMRELRAGEVKETGRRFNKSYSATNTFEKRVDSIIANLNPKPPTLVATLRGKAQDIRSCLAILGMADGDTISLMDLRSMGLAPYLPKVDFDKKDNQIKPKGVAKTTTSYPTTPRSTTRKPMWDEDGKYLGMVEPLMERVGA